MESDEKILSVKIVSRSLVVLESESWSISVQRDDKAESTSSIELIFVF